MSAALARDVINIGSGLKKVEGDVPPAPERMTIAKEEFVTLR
jgi:hypothetical protein